MKKRLIRISIGVVLLVVATLVVSAFFLGSIVKKGVETMGPKVTKVEVKLDSANVWLVPGHVQLKGLFIGNPLGCKTSVAIKMDEISVRMNPLTALSDTVVIENITVKSPDITIEGGLKKNNLTQIQKNMNEYVDSSDGSSTTESKPAASPDATVKPAKKYQINKIVITGARLHIISLFATGKNITLALPEIRLDNIGVGQGGVTSAEVAQKALAALLNSIAENAVDAIGKLGKDAASTVKKFDFKKAGQKLEKLFGQ